VTTSPETLEEVQKGCSALSSRRSAKTTGGRGRLEQRVREILGDDVAMRPWFRRSRLGGRHPFILGERPLGHGTPWVFEDVDGTKQWIGRVDGLKSA
jgi:hypothetical protein